MKGASLRGPDPKSHTADPVFTRQDGDPVAFDPLVRDHFPMVYNTCLRITRNRHDAEDAAQAVFLCLAEQLHENREIREVGPWLHQVARRASVDLHRRRKRRRTHEGFFGRLTGRLQRRMDPASALDTAELQRVVVEALNELPRKYRLPLILHYFGGLENGEIAEDLGCNRVTLRVRMHRGHKLLRESLKRRGVTLAGGLIGVVLAGAVRAHISQSMAGVGEQGFMLAGRASVHPDVLMVAAHVGSGPLRMKVAVAAAATVLASGLAAGSPIVQWFRQGNLPIPQMRMPEIPLPRLISPVPRLLSDATELTTQEQMSSEVASQERPGDLDTGQRPAGRVTGGGWATAALPRNERGSLARVRPVLAGGPGLSLAATGRVERGEFQWPSKGATGPDGAMRAAGFVLPAIATDTRAGNRAGADRLVSLVHGRSRPAIVTPPTPPGPATPPDRTAVAVSTETISPAIASAWPTVSFPVRPPVVTGTLSVISQTPGAVAVNVASAYSFSSGVEGTPVFLTTDSLTSYRSFVDWATAASPALYTTLDAQYRVIDNRLALNNNGQVISSSAASVRDYSAYDEIHNTIDNPRDGVNGWFAKNRGRVSLPSIAVSAGTNTYNWGEDAADTTPDLINSVRFTLNDQRTRGFVKIDLLATDSTQVPVLPAGHHFVGLWSFNDTGVAEGGVDLTIRYDSTRMIAELLDETQVKLWYYDGQWTRVWDVQKDLYNNRISGHVPDASFFAVSTPEPTGAVAILATAGAILLRRRNCIS